MKKCCALRAESNCKMKKLFSLLAAALVLVPAASCSKAPETLKVVSYNIRYGKAADGENAWEFRKDATPAMIAAVAPDVFGIQEAIPEQEAFILETCPDYKAAGVGREDGANEGERMSIFWNTKTVEMLEWGTIWLSETPDVPSKGWDARCKRTATWGYFEKKDSGRKFFFVNTHLDHRGVIARREGLALVRSEIARRNPDHLPMVLTGDFNILQSDSLIVDFSKEMNNARVTAEVTDTLPSFHGWGDCEKVIDYIYYDGFSACKRFQTHVERFAGKPYISDHYPIEAVLEF